MDSLAALHAHERRSVLSGTRPLGPSLNTRRRYFCDPPQRKKEEKGKKKKRKKKKEGSPSVPCSLPRPLAEPPVVQQPPNRLGNAGTPLPNDESEGIGVSDAWSVVTKAEGMRGAW
ncbi:hypothetical protein ES332_A01G065300v1 [Gossypium tomentosum]|uniref:Uncharacterized protein n=1 Tax=Gossypium tomentosum TaxID=34277 RepID=A0A5D2RPL3_GOSTO|nr:hypothetical protein ES332_A01G065300v1 [Gossypium tomentosum]